VRALFAGLATATVLLVSGVLHPPPTSGANFTAKAGSAPKNTVAADAVTNYLHLYSQSTDPAGLTGYAVKQNSSPSVLAATGSDLGLTMQLGGWKNAGTMNRVLTLETGGVSKMPPGGSITVTTIVPPVPSQPVSGATIAAVGSTGGVTQITLGPNQKRQLNLSLAKLPGNNAIYNGTVQLRVTWTGYSGTFLTYNVPFTIWDGNGGGP
jgi:hypothetical protein